MSIRLQHPCPSGRKTDAFGWRAAIPGVVAAQLHTGQDWAADAGAPVYAAHSGRVNRIWWDTFYDGTPAGGNMLQIGAAQASTRYAHLNAYAVVHGQDVQAGDLIGWVGQTGAATGDHLHFELLIGGAFVDPTPYIRATPATKKPTPQKEDTMKNAGFYYKNVQGKQINVVANPTSGFHHEFESAEGGYNSGIARGFGTGTFEKISASQAAALKRDCAAVRANG